MSATKSRGRRLKLTAELWQEYQGLGTFIPTEQDTALFDQLLGQARVAPANPRMDVVRASHSKKNLMAQLHYELGLIHQGVDPQRARRHFVRSEALVTPDYHNRPAFRGQLEHEYFRTMLVFMRERLDPSEREHLLNLRATVRNLGTLVVRGASAAVNLPAGKQGEGNRLLGCVTEIAAAGVLLAPLASSGHFVPTPASARQREPHKDHFRLEGSADGNQKASDFDIALLEYGAAADAAPSAITPVQVRLRRRGGDERYDQAVLMLLADRDLSVATPTDFIALGQGLMNYGRNDQEDSTLVKARAGVELAYETHHRI